MLSDYSNKEKISKFERHQYMFVEIHKIFLYCKILPKSGENVFQLNKHYVIERFNIDLVYFSRVVFPLRQINWVFS